MCRSDNFYQFVIKKFGQLSDPVANDVLKQLARQLAHPMRGAAKKRACVSQISQIIRPVALQVDRVSTKETFPHESAHFQHFERELVIMADGYF
jgi:hypothetical protein